MRVFFDTEFTEFRDGQLLSAGFVSDDDRSLYVEVDEPARRAAASDFCQVHVLPQFGLVPGSAVDSDVEAGRRIAEWLLGLGTTLEVCYDYKLDWRYLQQVVTLAGRWHALASRIQGRDIASETGQPAALEAQEEFFNGRVRPGRHHALIDAYALRERWRESRRIAGADGAGALHGAK